VKTALDKGDDLIVSQRTQIQSLEKKVEEKEKSIEELDKLLSTENKKRIENHTLLEEHISHIRASEAKIALLKQQLNGNFPFLLEKKKNNSQHNVTIFFFFS